MNPKLNGQRQNKIAFDDEIPNEGPELYMLRLKGAKCITFTVWGERVRGCYYHWLKDHSEPHYTDAENCPGCKARCETKWKGYLHGYASELRQEVFLELTRSAAKSLMTQLDNAASIRGAVIQVKRTVSDNGRLYITILNPCKQPELLPPEKDPRPSLLKLWGLSQQEIDDWLNPRTDPEARFEFQ